MGIRHKIAEYREYKSGVKHCTFNPGGPGVVRIHLVPPKFKLFRSEAYILILNGYYLLPLGYSWALILSYFINEVNRYLNSVQTLPDAERNTLVQGVADLQSYISAGLPEYITRATEQLRYSYNTMREQHPPVGVVW